MAHFPPPPAAIDWSNPGNCVREVNGHIESRFDSDTGQWSTPQFVRNPNISVHGLAPCFNYGKCSCQQAYEGMKACRNPRGQILLLRGAKHASRLAHSSSFVMIPTIPKQHFLQCVRLAVSNNAEFVPPHEEFRAGLYIRPVVFGSSAQLALLPAVEYIFCVYVQPFLAYHGASTISAVVSEDFDRVAPRGTGSAKIGGNYAPSMPSMERARREGFGITLHLDSRTQTNVDEFATAAFIGIKSSPKPTIVFPETDSSLRSVTSESCAQLATSLGWSVERRTVTYSELASFDEVVAAGTVACLVGISSITHKSRNEKFTYGSKTPQMTNGNSESQHDNGGENGNGLAAPDSCRQILDSMLRNIQRGVVEDIYGWTERIRCSEHILPGMERR